MGMIRRFAAFLALWGLCLLSPPGVGDARADVTGKAWVIDGDTIHLAGYRIRLWGIDAPEEGQTCTRGEAAWDCGAEATFALANLLGRHWVTCKDEAPDGPDGLVAICYMGPWDINARVVRDGWALAEPGNGDYAGAQAVAERHRAGLWQGTFQAPWDWRRDQGLGPNR